MLRADTLPSIPNTTQPSGGTYILESKILQRPSATFQEYTDFQKKQQSDDAGDAAKAGVKPPSPDALSRAALTEADYNQRLHDERFQTVRIIYKSGQLKVAGYIFKPVKIHGKRLPAIIFNRGGQGDLGAIGPMTILEMHSYLAAGFVVIASQYRGCDGGEGNDEFGGADVDDVLNLVPVVRELGYIDPKNLFMFGVSRGGMETFLAMKKGIPINAAAVLGASADEVLASKQRPFIEVYTQRVPGFKLDPEAAYRQRSAVDWADQLNAPLLILHGGADWRVSPSQPLELATRLEQLHKPFQLFIFADDNHSLALHREQKENAIISWFQNHVQPQ